MNNNATGTISAKFPYQLKSHVQVTYPSFRKHMTGKAGAENTEKTIQNLVHDIKKYTLKIRGATRQSTR